MRIDQEVHDALKHWADDELRSLNGQIEFLLRRALIDRKRLRRSQPATEADGGNVPLEDE